MVCPAENCPCGYHRVLEYLHNGQNEQSRLFIENLGNIRDATDAQENTLLHHSIDQCNVEITQYLIDAGCNVNVQNVWGITPLMRAIQKKAVAIVATLLKSNADIYAVQCINGRVSILSCTWNMYVQSSIDFESRSLRHILEMLFDRVNRDFSENEHLLTHFLLKSNNTEKLLVVASGSENLKRFIIKNGYPVDYAEQHWGFTALHCAVRLAKLDSVQILIELGANVDTVNKHGISLIYSYLLHSQDADENSEILKILLRKSTRLSKINSFGLSGVAMLLSQGTKKTVRTLLLSGIDVNSCLGKGESIMYYIICNRDSSVLDLISELNIEFNANEYNAPHLKSYLIMAAEKQCPKTVQFLLDRGADVHFCPSAGTALTNATIHCEKENGPGTEARKIKQAKVVELLLQYGADAQIVVQNNRWLIDILSAHRRENLCTKVIVAHLALLGSSDPPTLTDLTRGKVESGPLKLHFHACTQQLEKLKNLNVYGTVTMFKLLSEREDKLTSYARNSEFISAFNSAKENISDIESYYLNSLERRVSKAVGEAKLQERVSLVICALTGLCADVYSVIVYKIIGYLDRREMVNLCETIAAKKACTNTKVVSKLV